MNFKPKLSTRKTFICRVVIIFIAFSIIGFYLNEVHFQRRIVNHLQQLEHRALTLYQPPSFPKIIHQSWKNVNKVPSLTAEYMASWKKMNQDYEYWFWSDNDNFLIWLHPELLPYRAFAQKLGAIQLSDMCRYAYMYLFGGIYADIDFECLKSFDSLPHAKLILSPEPRIHTELFGGSEISNAILISTPKQSFWKRVLENIVKWPINSCNVDPISCTGPIQVLRSLKDILNSANLSLGAEKGLLVLPEDYFFPEFSEEVGRLCHNFARKSDADKRKEKKDFTRLCKHFYQNPNGVRTNNTLAVHHWACRWCGRTKDSNFQPLETILEPFTFIQPLATASLLYYYRYFNLFS